MFYLMELQSEFTGNYRRLKHAGQYVNAEAMTVFPFSQADLDRHHELLTEELTKAGHTPQTYRIWVIRET